MNQAPDRADQIAARTWNQERPISETSNAIHDGARTEEELKARGRWYVKDWLFETFPGAVPSKDARILEIGSGLGWIMQSMNEYLSERHLPPQEIVGLDIAPNMIKQARERLGEKAPYSFLLYDGVSVPRADHSLDLIYSVAALQHVPRPFVFNLFFEMKRLLAPGGSALLHMPSTDQLPIQETHHTWRTEISNQINGATGHWHHFYTAKELRDVLKVTGFRHVAVWDDGAGTLIVCVSDSAAPLGAIPPEPTETLNREEPWEKLAKLETRVAALEQRQAALLERILRRLWRGFHR